MPGVSLTLLVLPRPNEAVPFTADQILSHLDDIPDVAAWKLAIEISIPGEDEDNGSNPSAKVDKSESSSRRVVLAKPSGFVTLLKAACEALQDAEPEITKMDQVGGDGDCGFTLKHGAEGVLTMISTGRITGTNLIDDVRAITDAVGDTMDGTSGALYS
jgi:dihydroxyacetone kinase